MYERVTELDSNFKKNWTFNPLDKEDLPEFVKDSDKSFRIHIKYPKKDYEKDSYEESDEENDEEEMIENLKDFLKAYSTRIVSFTITCDSDDDGQDFDFFKSLLREISNCKPKWVNLKTIRISYDYEDLGNIFLHL